MSRSPDRLTDWLHLRRRGSNLRCRPIAWDECREWVLRRGELVRSGGGFFTIRGFHIDSAHRSWNGREEPLIDQPEIGILGFLGRRTSDSATEILVHAKTEPGNTLGTQLAPTVQATISNYTRVHGGRPTPHLEQFLDPEPSTVSVDVEQSEQGTVFLGKYNRNVLLIDALTPVEVDTPSLKWFPVGELLEMLGTDFAVNTDARSVLCCSDWRDLVSGATPFARWRGSGSFGEMLFLSYSQPSTDQLQPPVSAWLAGLWTRPHFDLHPLALDQLAGWSLTPSGLQSDTTGSFLRLYDIEVDDREVPHWQQPLVGDQDANRVVLLCQERRGVLQFLVRAACEPGFSEGVQLGPTAQSHDRRAPGVPLVSFALEAGHVVLSVNQSEEGGRLFQTESRYEIRLIADDELAPPDETARWLTLGDLHRLARSRGLLTNELRSAISLLLMKL